MEYLAPKASEIDEQNRFPVETVRELAKLGFMGIAYPEEWGGAGADSLTEAIVVEEISYGCAATGSILTAHYLGLDGIFLYGNDEQKNTWLTPACDGRKLAAFCLTEPGAGSDVASVLTTAVLDGDEYVINGTKHFITNAAYADFLVVYAMTDRSQRNRGLSAFIVDKGTPGLSFGSGDNKMGIRAARTYEVIFDNCRVPKANRIGKEGEGFKIAMQVIDRGRIGVAAMAVGLSQAALDAAVAYAKQRVVFGHPIAEYQGIQWMIAEMAADVVTARAITYEAAELRDSGLRISKEAAIAKLFASEAAYRVVHKAVQIHGGSGYMKEYPVERFYRDQRILELFEGTSQVQKMVIARHVFG
ncbi:acyl-CoA dehydrogenase family protein [Kyrpidia sp.]|uniref:acyl-CoA dehydrogenase family protein n=1 Tax=Kyrpidia sp. TaxID=2073077 RepID=UPI0025898F48|nr:acyl-CoA dehydrogenase family protein [Kyrpidia sp.]MCL6577291.1 acyl-CoA dehydrogenase family protein [Kyrpidia sp.]